MEHSITGRIGNQASLSRLAEDKETAVRRKPHQQSGIPASLKQRAEEKSGLSLDDVSVHYNSASPSRYQALAYTQGNQVYIGPGQEKYLAHELGHVVQQKQGRVRATKTIGGQPLNDNADLEREADRYL